MFSSQVYYHYFVAAVPFAALLAAPFVLRIVRGAPLIAAAGALIASVLFATDIAAGSAPARLFITAASFSSVHNTVQILDRSTSPNQPVLTDQFEYSYLAHRPSLDDYFWNMQDVVKAHDLENRLLKASAVVRTMRVAPTYPRGFIEYLEGHGYRRTQTGLTEVWLLSGPRVADVLAGYGPACRQIIRSGRPPVYVGAAKRLATLQTSGYWRNVMDSCSGPLGGTG